MAVDFKQIKQKIENPELTADDMAIVDEIEKMIDSEILEQVDKGNYKEIPINIKKLNPFIEYVPAHKVTAMFLALKARYKIANWKLIKANATLQLDGISWCLQGKNQRQKKPV